MFAKQSGVRRRTSLRTAFTLVEIMITLVIIAVLLGLLLPALRNAFNTARIAQVQSEMEQLKTSITQFKVRFGMEPPSSIILHEAPAAWGTDARSRGLVKRLWPQFDFASPRDLNADGDSNDNFHMDGAECLVFFLGGMVDTGTGAFIGFAKNPRNPLQTGSGTRDGPFFEFQGSVTGGTPSGRLTNADGDLAYEYLDPLPSQTRPYLYFSSYEGTGYRRADNTEDLNDNGTLDTGEDVNGNGQLDIRIAHPYYQDAALNSPYNRDSFQLISPGFDGEYGDGGSYGSGALLMEQERDNITNFHTGLLDG